MFNSKLFFKTYRDERQDKFLHLEQGELSVSDCEKFTKLIWYSMGIVDTERERCRQFKNGLTAEIRTPVIANTVYNDYTKLPPSILLCSAAQPSRNRNRAVAELPAAPGESSKPICAAERPSEQPSLARRSRVEAASARPQPTRQPAESRRFDPTQAQPKRQSVAVAERSRGSRTTNSRRAARNPEAEASRARPSRVSPVASRAASPPVASRAAREIPVPSRAASAQAEPVLSSSSRAARTKLAPSTYILRGISSVGARALQPPSRDFVAWKAYCLAVRTRQVDLQIYFGYDECRDGECRNDLCDMLYADAMCMYTAIRVPVSLILLESYLHGCPSGSPPIEDCVVSPGTEDQSYVPTGAHDCTCSGTCQRLGRGRGKGKGKLASDPK
ncbi:uncharacterized protein E6C27_scaffold20G00150 [Cucumis melo var. makuwa]|uniref:Uncharacterized protein n=1 Tax=Cucumis melo var. makuwa TaxID=1194695 RepID=A0A5A7T1V1_CUCMM|nr:uncharacterized protein E6C27_scaffold20G00150 [Cucumis melo var. makuwa]